MSMPSLPNAPVILCVDDDATGLRLRQLILEAKGYKAHLATSVQQGMEIFQSTPVDLVITDHLLGRAAGTDMAASFKQLKPHVPVLILSGSTSPPEGAERADAYLCKSEGPQALLSRVAALLETALAQQEHVETHIQTLAVLSRERLTDILESVAEAVITVDRQQRVVLFNKAAETMFGCTGDQARGRLLDSFIPERFRAVHREHVREFGHTGVTRRSMSRPGILVGLHASGEEFPIEATISQVGSGNEKSFTVVLRDITERKQAEELLAIVESSNDAIISKTLDGIVTNWSRGAEQMFGYTAKEMAGKPVAILLPPDKFREEDDALVKIRRGERVPPHDTVRVAKDGRVLYVSVSAAPIYDAAKNVVGAASIVRDRTEIQMAETALRNSEKMVIAGRMAATVAHEINGPLEAVANILFLLDRGQLSDTAREFVRLAQEEVMRIGQITKLTLGFHREGEDRSATKVRTSELIDGILTLYGHRIESLGVSIEKRYDSAGAVIANAGELRQVFSNLILNASEALAKKGSKLLIHVYDSSEWTDAERKGVRITIADNGSGISREVRRRLFEPFFTTKGEKGTGLGLWVSKSLVEKHGGSLRVRSSPGVGTAFSVFLLSNAANAMVA